MPEDPRLKQLHELWARVAEMQAACGTTAHDDRVYAHLETVRQDIQKAIAYIKLFQKTEGRT
jgi:hypothetical protein